MAANCKRWWGDFSLTEGRWAHFQIGPLSLFARRVPGEWRFAWRSNDPYDDKVEIDLNASSDPDLSGCALGRFALREPGEALRIMPRMADRAVVVRPETPLYIMAHEETALYVSTPVWVALSTTHDSAGLLTEIPSFRPSDTWFGENTRAGEVCYASKTNARTQINLEDAVPHRVVTPIEIRNNGSDNLTIEQLRIPAPNLNLYTGANERLWTDRVCFERSSGEWDATLRIIDESAEGKRQKTKIADARRVQASTSIVHSFSRFFTG